MKTKIILLLYLSLNSCSTLSFALESPEEFLSWYDGWGVHTLWGIGNVRGSYNSAFIKCKETVVPVKAIYDSHSDENQPEKNQTKNYAEKNNLELQEKFKSQGIDCTFELVKNDD